MPSSLIEILWLIRGKKQTDAQLKQGSSQGTNGSIFQIPEPQKRFVLWRSNLKNFARFILQILNLSFYPNFGNSPCAQNCEFSLQKCLQIQCTRWKTIEYSHYFPGACSLFQFDTIKKLWSSYKLWEHANPRRSKCQICSSNPFRILWETNLYTDKTRACLTEEKHKFLKTLSTLYRVIKRVFYHPVKIIMGLFSLKISNWGTRGQEIQSGEGDLKEKKTLRACNWQLNFKISIVFFSHVHANKTFC